MEESSACQAEPCLYTLETGKHEWNSLHWKHQANDEIWIPHCPKCGWVDISRMMRALSFWQRVKILMCWI